MNYLERYDIK